MEAREEILSLLRDGLIVRHKLNRHLRLIKTDAAELLAAYDAKAGICKLCGSSITDAKPVFHQIGFDP